MKNISCEEEGELHPADETRLAVRPAGPPLPSHTTKPNQKNPPDEIGKYREREREREPTCSSPSPVWLLLSLRVRLIVLLL